jgi:hypothetical protein
MTTDRDSRGPKERVYDEKFSPLVAQLIALAREHGITMLAHFHFGQEYEDGPSSCTTSIPKPGDDGLAREFLGLVRPRACTLAITIIGGGKPEAT